MLLTISIPAITVIGNATNVTVVPSSNPCELPNHINPAISAAPAGLGNPWKNSLSALAACVLNRARRRAVAAARAAGTGSPEPHRGLTGRDKVLMIELIIDAWLKL